MPRHIGDNNFNTEVLENKGVVLVDFFATWCGPCKMIAPIIDELEAEMGDVKFVKVDVDESPEVATRYGIQSIPTLKVFKDGENVDTVVGFLPKEQIKALIEKNM
ncbi:thioredoxin [Clostridium baratii]|uniref:Thioredoxin n=2 Tax=Clostridium baratii TaxID=1561 RepID=A0A0A7FVN0_9CLOT|nr:thioredoxin [Clostridium baratii]AIY83643.1 thioredoxin [Clostridium baratii str. Sullivan]AQM59806.1 thiol reductase thioredoxin [Clostridium baratii]MBS6043669.1 thioredoxin [Clostridium baratii]MBT9831394.1 thioredoxin [Clostridium baratii]MDU4912331.1 thioredoxin [Clostridium baratii]